MQQQFGDDVTIIGIPSLASVDSMRGFVEDTGTSGIPHIPDVEGVLWDRYGVSEQRTYVLINDDGARETTGYGALASQVEALIAN